MSLLVHLTFFSRRQCTDRAMNSFTVELNALSSACNEQEQELRILQNLMYDQMCRSKAISDEEERVFHALNALEIDARNFVEESHLVTNMYHSVSEEVEAISHVKLMSVPFNVVISQDTGRYPTINNLRLAYRVNEKASLSYDEVIAAWVQAAQLVAFTCGLHNGFVSPHLRIIPLSHPCAKIVATFADGQSVHNLGWDVVSGADRSKHIDPPSILCFLALLSQLAEHIVNATKSDPPPFSMTLISIDSVDVTKLTGSDTAWSSVVYCIAVNLHWLSNLQVH